MTGPAVAIVAGEAEHEVAERLRAAMADLAHGVARSRRPVIRTGEGAGLGDADWLLVVLGQGSAHDPGLDAHLGSLLTAGPPIDHVLLAWAGGEVAWDPARSTFSSGSAVPPRLGAAFSDEPRWVDLRSGVTDDNAAELLAPVVGVPKAELVGIELRRHRRAIRVAIGALVVLALLAASAVVATRTARDRRNASIRRRHEVRSVALAASSQEQAAIRPDLSMLLAVESWNQSPSTAGLGALARARTDAADFPVIDWGDGRSASGVAVDAEGAAYIVRDGGRLDRWADGSERPVAIRRGLPSDASVALDPAGAAVLLSPTEGTLLAIDAGGRTRGRWELGAGLRARRPTRHAPIGRSGRTLIGFEDGALAEVGPRHAPAAIVATGTGGRIDDMDVDVAGRQVAVISTVGNRVDVYDIDRDGSLRGRRSAQVTSPTAVRFTADGSRLVVGGLDGSVQAIVPSSDALTDGGRNVLHRAAVLTIARVGASGALSVALDGQVNEWSLDPLHLADVHRRLALSVPFVLATPANGDRAKAVGLDRRGVSLRLPAKRSVGRAVATTGGHLSATAAGTGVVVDDAGAWLEVWDLTTSRPRRKPGTIRIPITGVRSAAPLRDGASVAVGHHDGSVDLVNASNGRVLDTMGPDQVGGRPGHDYSGQLVVVGPGQLAFGIGGGARLLRVRGTRLEAGPWLVRRRNGVDTTSVAATPDGRRLAVAASDGTVRVVSLGTGRGRSAGPAIDTGSAQRVRVALTPDGARLATANIDGRLQVWDVASGRSTSPGLFASGLVTGLGFVRSGSVLVATSTDTTARLWDARSGQSISGDGLSLGAYLEGLVVTSDDGKILMDAPGGRLRRLDLDPVRAAQAICAAVGRDLTRDEWSAWVGQEAYEETCPLRRHSSS